MNRKLSIKYVVIIFILLILSINMYTVYSEGRTNMTYREEQRKKAINLLGNMFDDSGGGKFANGHYYPFVLQDFSLNLWVEIRQNALSYFKNNNIPWWMSTPEMPTGHLLSSQIACVNHLYYLRNKKDLSKKVLQSIDNRIIEAVEILYPDTNTGYVAFEIVGKNNYLGERQHTRGANATSVDAIMIGKKLDGKNILVLIEWKYTEYYDAGKSLYIPARFKIYNPLLEATDSPFKTISYNDKPFEPLYYEPFYELMRQTLLGWKMVRAQEYDCDEYIHLYIVPNGNNELLFNNTSKGLIGNTVEAAWKNVLKNPNLFRIITPEKLLEPIINETDTISFFEYLGKRYWN